MASVNKVILIGNLTRDPELRYTPKQTAVTEVGMAVNRRYRVDNELREEVTYIEVTFWGPAAETIAKYMEKGRPLYVEGRLKFDQWDDRETGKKRSKLSVVGENFQFLGSGGGGSGAGGSGNRGPLEDSQGYQPSQGGSSGGGSTSQAPASPPPATGSGPLADDEEDDIPF